MLFVAADDAAVVAMAMKVAVVVVVAVAMVVATVLALNAAMAVLSVTPPWTYPWSWLSLCLGCGRGRDCGHDGASSCTHECAGCPSCLRGYFCGCCGNRLGRGDCDGRRVHHSVCNGRRGDHCDYRACQCQASVRAGSVVTPKSAGAGIVADAVVQPNLVLVAFVVADIIVVVVVKSPLPSLL